MIHIIFMILELFIVLLHVCGIYLLRCLHSSGVCNAQQILIMNLSAIEIFMNIFYFIIHLKEYFQLTQIEFINFNVAHKFITIASKTTVCYIYYSIMAYIAIDKMLMVWLRMKYTVYCDIGNTNHLVALTWVIGIIMCISVVVGYNVFQLEHTEPTEYLLAYLLIMFVLIFIFIAVGSLGYIFYKNWKTYMDGLENRPPSHRKLSTMNFLTHPRSLLVIFKKSRFFTSTSLVITFFLFTAIPDLVITIREIKREDKKYHNLEDVGLSTLYHLSFLSNFFIYVFMYEPVRELLQEKIRKISQKEVKPVPLVSPVDEEEERVIPVNLQYVTSI